LGIAAPLLTVAGLLVGVWEFNRGERNRVVLENQLLLQKDTIEFQRKLWLEKLDAYRALVILAGKIASAAGEQDGPKNDLGTLARELTASTGARASLLRMIRWPRHFGSFTRPSAIFRPGGRR
jgi:hypothetical protein